MVLIIPWIVGGAIALLGIAIVSSGSKNGELTFSDESDCSEEFLRFDENISITASKLKKLNNSRSVLQKKIKDYFSHKAGIVTPTFYIQGSSKHGTIIRKQDDTCDIDVGIYFAKRPPITPTALHKNVVAAIGEHTSENPTIKSKCVRVYYASLFHIDLPVYYRDGDKYYIAIGNSGWREDDPKLFTNWMKENFDDDPQKIRVVKYFKAWTDVVKTKLSQKMPSGLALTIWTSKHFEGDGREDLAFLKTAISLRDYLSKESKADWECTMPTVPGDNVIDKLSEDQRGNFLTALNTLVDESIGMTTSSSKEDCLAHWKSTFGKWF